MPFTVVQICTSQMSTARVVGPQMGAETRETGTRAEKPAEMEMVRVGFEVAVVLLFVAKVLRMKVKMLKRRRSGMVMGCRSR